MGYVKKGNASWYYVAEVGINPVTGNRKRKKKSGFKTKREAELALAQIETEVSHGSYVEPSNMLYKDYLLEWFKGKRNSIGEQTVVVYENILNSRIIPSLGHFSLSKINAMYIQKYINSLKEEGLASATVKKIFEVIRNSLAHAKDLDIIPKNVAEKIKLPKDPKKEMEVWGEEEIKKFFEVAKNNRYFMAFYLAISTGMRQGEILGVCWKDIDFIDQSLCIKQTLKHDGKGFLVGGKTKSSNRTVALTSETIVLLKRHRAMIAKEKLSKGGGYEDHDLVVCTEHGTPLNPANLRRTFRRLISQANIPEIKFHALRHTHATLLLSKGVNVKVISERLGHSNIKVTLDVYSHVLPTMQEEAVKQIDNLLSSAK
ncbi:site-specific integrase [Bacillus sp. FJAT-29790]|uniref:site-specific integrase n=1 Tax=Bacillus sp. FJAT-29790 TaxID=1895002 RepID=UPI001C2364C1|nr:site-specific integrase [Bacillus sp. FJAT-29790]MBU8880617.1 site-specific integrase [Bacillus sp. FJAT-29790]